MPYETPQANPTMLTLAREAASMTQAETAAAMSKLSGAEVSQGYVSRAESGRLAVTGERLEYYARTLACTDEMLCLDPQAAAIGIGLIHHRKKAALSAPALRCIHARLALTRIQITSLLASAGTLPATDRFVRVDLDDYTAPRDTAAQVRSTWGIPGGPIPDLVTEVENAGAVVLLRDLGSDLLDAVSVWNGAEPPLLLVSSHSPADRRRFSIAHEIGHLVMHQSPGAGAAQEKQADEFAAALLMPAADIRGEFDGAVDLARLLELKARWGVSMSALAKRAQSLGRLSDWQYRNLMIEMSALGYRTAEPGIVAPEDPFRVHEAIEALRTGKNMDDGEIAERMRLRPEVFAALYTPDKSGDHVTDE